MSSASSNKSSNNKVNMKIPAPPEHKVVANPTYLRSNLKNSLPQWCAYSVDQCKFVPKKQGQVCYKRHGQPKVFMLPCHQCNKTSMRSEEFRICTSCYESKREDAECLACTQTFRRNINSTHKIKYCQPCYASVEQEFEDLKQIAASSKCPSCDDNTLKVIYRVEYEDEDEDQVDATTLVSLSGTGKLTVVLTDECSDCYRALRIEEKQEAKDLKIKAYQNRVNERYQHQKAIDSLPQVPCSYANDRDDPCSNFTRYSPDGGLNGEPLGFPSCRRCYLMESELQQK
jgi:hypothetical protein